MVQTYKRFQKKREKSINYREHLCNICTQNETRDFYNMSILSGIFWNKKNGVCGIRTLHFFFIRFFI